MTANGPLTGGNCKMYYNSASFDIPTWVEIDEVEDVNITEFDVNMAEIATRAGKFISNLDAKERAVVEAAYLYGANKTVFDFLLQARLAKTVVDLAVCDGDIANDCEGLRIQSKISTFPINQAVEEAAMVDTITFVNAYITDQSDVRIEPTWIVVTGGTIGAAAEGFSQIGGVPIKSEIYRQLMRERVIVRHDPYTRILMGDLRERSKNSQLLRHIPDGLPVHVHLSDYIPNEEVAEVAV